MFANQDLKMVKHRQDELRAQAAQDRMAEKTARHERRSRTRRVLGLRLSLA